MAKIFALGKNVAAVAKRDEQNISSAKCYKVVQFVKNECNQTQLARLKLGAMSWIILGKICSTSVIIGCSQSLGNSVSGMSCRVFCRDLSNLFAQLGMDSKSLRTFIYTREGKNYSTKRLHRSAVKNAGTALLNELEIKCWTSSTVVRTSSIQD